MSARQRAADKAGGLVAVARNPVTASFAAQYGAPKSLKMAIELGRRMQEAESGGGEAVAGAAVSFLGGSIVTRAAGIIGIGITPGAQKF